MNGQETFSGELEERKPVQLQFEGKEKATEETPPPQEPIEQPRVEPGYQERFPGIDDGLLTGPRIPGATIETGRRGLERARAEAAAAAEREKARRAEEERNRPRPALTPPPPVPRRRP